MFDIGKVKVKRRTVVKGLGGAGLVAASPALLHVPEGKADPASPSPQAKGVWVPPGKPRYKYSELETFHSTCAMECLHCNLTAYTYKGKLVKVEAQNTQGLGHINGCLRGISRTKWVQHKDRVTTPLLRVGEKGEGKFKPISWDEAFDLIEKNIRDTIKQHGNAGMLLSTHAGNMDNIKNAMGHAFFDYLGGATKQLGSLCCVAVTAAMMPMLGLRYADTRDTIADSRYLLCWGNNPAVTMQAYWTHYNEARKNGARLVVIDPRYSETAAKADEWIPIIPGTDTALALGMMKIIIEEGRIDEAFLRARTGAVYLVDAKQQLMRQSAADPDSYLVYDLASGKLARHDAPGVRPALFQSELPEGVDYATVFEQVYAQAKPWTVDEVSRETDVPVQTILRLARDYSTTMPAMIVQNMSGAQRTEHGTYVVASQFYLALLTGNIGKPGAGVCDAGGAKQLARFNPPIPPSPNLKKIPPIPIPKVGEWVLNDKPGPIGFWWIMTMGMLTQMPNTNVVKAAMKKVPFVVVADNLMTSSTLYADLVLPVTTIFEDVSLMAADRSHQVQLMEKAVEPPGEAKPDYWIFARLAERFGFGEVFNQPIEHYIDTVLAGTGITREMLKKGPIKPHEGDVIPWKDGKFRTSTTKANFFVEDWQKKGYSPVLAYYPVKESPKGAPELAQKYPLMAVQRKLARSIHSSHGANEWILEVQRNKPQVMIHRDDAIERSIRHGEWVTVYNDRGEWRAIADVSTRIKKGVVSIENGWWEQQGGSSSHVTNDAYEPLSAGHCCNSTLVNVRA